MYVNGEVCYTDANLRQRLASRQLLLEHHALTRDLVVVHLLERALILEVLLHDPVDLLAVRQVRLLDDVIQEVLLRRFDAHALAHRVLLQYSSDHVIDS